jgi:hypothetical protein
MQNSSPLERFTVGAFLTLAGLLIIVLHRSIKEWYDRRQSRDWPLGLGDAWTGKYTRGGLIFTYVVIILFGVLLLYVGIAQIVVVLRHV